MICKSKKKGEGKVVTLWKKKKDIFASIADMIKKKCRDLSNKFLSSADKIVMLTDAPLCSDFESSTVIDLIEGWMRKAILRSRLSPSLTLSHRPSGTPRRPPGSQGRLSYTPCDPSVLIGLLLGESCRSTLWLPSQVTKYSHNICFPFSAESLSPSSTKP